LVVRNKVEPFNCKVVSALKPPSVSATPQESRIRQRFDPVDLSEIVIDVPQIRDMRFDGLFPLALAPIFEIGIDAHGE
jgi:hypothetical protein